MDLITDKEYLSLVSSQLERFTPQTGDVWRFRCPFCGDSQKNRFKTRCYVYNKGGHLVFFCHNCSETGGIYKLLKHVNPQLANEYAIHSFVNRDKKRSFEYTTVAKSLPVKINTMNIPSIDTLPETHSAVVYLNSRKIPKKFYSDLYYTDNYKEYVHGILPNCDKELNEEGMIVIPLRNREGVLTGVQGRAVGFNSEQRYATIQLVEETLSYGLDRINPDKPVYVLEGAFDSMFIPNSVAAMTSALYKVEIPDAIYVFDNEPRNEQIINIMKKTIKKDFKVCIWPDFLVEKDVNDMVLAGRQPEQIVEIINQNIHHGLRASLELNQWKKI